MQQCEGVWRLRRVDERVRPHGKRVADGECVRERHRDRHIERDGDGHSGERERYIDVFLDRYGERLTTPGLVSGWL